MTLKEIRDWMLVEINVAYAVDAKAIAATPEDVRFIEIFYHGEACGLTQALHMLDLLED